MKKILVTGGAGYIGSHTIVDLIENDFEVISIDNLSRSYADVFDNIEKITGIRVPNYNIDLCNWEELKKVVEQHKNTDGIIHFAAFKSVPESVENPILYYDNNINSLLNILKICKEYQISNFVFSSSCSVYGNPDVLPVTENTPLKQAECAYAATKQMGETIVADIANRFQINSMALRYFNPVGAHESALIGENSPDKPNNLLPIVTQTAAGIMKQMQVWGTDYDTRDGSCIRDYVHVMDIANAHTKALLYLLDTKNTDYFTVLNLGSGNGVSVLEIISSFEKISGVKLNYTMGGRRSGDVEAVYGDNSKAKNMLKWQPQRSTDDMLRSAWAWQKKILNK